jgi:hypothetical protein
MTTSTRPLIGAWLIGGCLAAIGLVRIASAIPERIHDNDFAHYYVTSRLWLEGRDPYATPFAAEFAKYDLRYNPRIPSGTNPPLLVVAFAPLSALSPTWAFALWAAVQTAALAATLLMICALLRERLRPEIVPILLGLLLASRALYFHYYFSQVQLLLGAVVIAAFCLHRAKRYSAAVILVTCAGLLKLFPLVLLPWFILSAPGRLTAKALRAIPAAVLGCFVFALTWRLWPGFLGSGSAILRAGVLNQTFQFSLPSLIVNVGWTRFGFAPTPESGETIWRLASASGLLLIVFTYAVLLKRRANMEAGFCALLLVSILAAPSAWGHYFVLAFFPFSVLFADAARQLTPWRVAGLAAAYVLILDLVNGSSLPLAVTWRIILAYLPLYAALALTSWFLFAAKSKQDVTVLTSH